ncbi:MAG TPA: HD domain-containing phosphohydrolase [Vicinamibacterales bacterium]|nr:HD domain-containing phosphohydrolase [Vicinamibacterales bacterium]
MELYEDLLRKLASGIRGAQLYAPGHPITVRNMEALADVLRQLHGTHPSLTVGIVGNQIIVADTPMPRATAQMGDLIRKLKSQSIERIAFERGVTIEQLEQFVRLVAASAQADQFAGLAHIRVGRIADDDQVAGIQSDMAAIRKLYSDAVNAAESVWSSAEVEGKPDTTLALQTVEGLSEAVTQNRTALIALTAMKSYDNYTFTHMVNVSILTMGQARALGMEGRLLRELGLSGLMHDIGKVRTPKEVLNKPEKLTDTEFEIMKRHTVDGAEILRRTPEMPILAPVVAFEHHLRIDGTGYPRGAKRSALNLGTQLCSVADVYDAMRSQRAYQQAFPTDRILAVLKRDDGAQFDRHLVRRFTQLLGIYPPGNLVRLSTGEVAVVVKVHAPDPYRPRVRVIADRGGQRLEVPLDRNLWDASDERGQPLAIQSPIDPADYGVDPLSFM